MDRDPRLHHKLFFAVAGNGSSNVARALVGMAKEQEEKKEKKKLKRGPARDYSIYIYIYIYIYLNEMP